MQVPVHAFAQQTPCWQKPELHSAAEPQALPFALRAHAPPMHTVGDAQSALVVQTTLQALAPHTYGKHDRGAGTTHVPVPLQLAAAVDVVLPAGQVAAAHDVPLAYSWQAAPAAHLPFVPQLAAPMSLHVPEGSTVPLGTLVQVPSVPASAHD
jgi:hypothetical protein